MMANLNVRNLDDDVYKQLRIQAATHGVSMEEEARRIICAAVCTPEPIGDVFYQNFGPNGGVVLELPKHSPHQLMDFNDCALNLIDPFNHAKNN
jgi:plasmid stability protein